MPEKARGPKAGGPVGLADGGRAARSADAPVQTEEQRLVEAETLKEVMRKLEEALRLSLELEREEPSERG